jgi:hypothetical protein
VTVEPIDRPSRITKGCEPMKFMQIYLVGYFILLIGAGLALWQAGILNQIAPIWIAICAIIAVGLGVMLAVTSGKPEITTGRE